MDHSNLGIFEVVEDILTGNDALLIVTAAGTERVPQTAFCIDRVGCCR